MKIQIAGIRNVEDALMCADCGANIIGLLVGQKHASDDFITKELARQIKLALPKKTKTTLITHLEKAKDIIEIAKYIDVDYVQLHSDLPESEVEKIRKELPSKKLIRVIHIDKNGKLLTDIEKIKIADFYFTDSINKKTGQVGGTGLTHNFETDKKLVDTLNKPVFIAGGLNADNVAAVIRWCHPYGVDVNSGCRAKNGRRDKNKVLAFVENVKKAKKSDDKKNMDELIDVYDENQRHTGREDRFLVHRLGIWHKAIHGYLINDKNEIVIQQRTADSYLYPSFWDMSFAGHIDAGEDSKTTAIRECFEELGVKLKESEVEYLFTNPEELAWGDVISKEFVDVYLCRKNFKVIKKQDEEVKAVRVLKLQDFIKMLKERDKTLLPHYDEYDKMIPILEMVLKRHK